MATYVISDIHGCYDEFLLMLKKIDLKETDRLILAGDYIDRGKKNLEMLKWLEHCPENVTPIKGNHDAEYIENVQIMRQVDKTEELKTNPESNEDAILLYDSVQYMLKKAGSLVVSFFDYYGTIDLLLNKNHVSFGDLCRWADTMDNYPYFYRFLINDKDCVVVHAGFCEDDILLKGGTSSKEQFYLYAREDAIKIGGIRNGLVVAGHTPTIAKNTPFYTDGEVFRYYDKDKDCVFYDIDCGCAYYENHPSGTMACLRLEDEEVFYL